MSVKHEVQAQLFLICWRYNMYAEVIHEGWWWRRKWQWLMQERIWISVAGYSTKLQCQNTCLCLPVSYGCT